MKSNLGFGENEGAAGLDRAHRGSLAGFYRSGVTLSRNIVHTPVFGGGDFALALDEGSDNPMVAFRWSSK